MRAIRTRRARHKQGDMMTGAADPIVFTRRYQVDALREDKFLMVHEWRWRRLTKCVASAVSPRHDWAQTFGSVIAGIGGSAITACLTVPSGSSFGSGWPARMTLLVAGVALFAVAALLFLASHARSIHSRNSALDALEEIKGIETTFSTTTR